MCNLYNHTRAVAAIRSLFPARDVANCVAILEPGSVYPYRLAPVVRHGSEGLELARARWGLRCPYPS